MNVAIICISLLAMGVNIWNIVNTHRRYESLRWKVTRLAILDARSYIDHYRSTGITASPRNAFSGSYKRRYSRAFVRTLASKEVH